ncbi:MAG: hypothetical protein V4625_06795 [Pseudomonadota bacterium]
MTQNFYPVKSLPPKRAITAHQAVENSPTLGRLAELVKESSDRFRAIESLIPENLRPAVKAGPIDGDTWCLLVSSNAAAAKLRQLTPLIQSRLLGKGWKVTSIRLKILISKKY